MPDLNKVLARPSPKIGFGKKNRFELLFKEKEWRQNPGPGSYYMENSATTILSPTLKEKGGIT